MAYVNGVGELQSNTPTFTEPKVHILSHNGNLDTFGLTKRRECKVLELW
jgi:hypothetical protein